MTDQSNPQVTYNDPPDGMGMYGLQTIKNVEVPTWEQTAAGWRLNKNLLKSGFRYVFCHASIENCFLNHEEKAFFGERAGNYLLIQNMSGGKLTGPVKSPEEMASLMEMMKGRWFNCMVGSKTLPAKTFPDGKSFPEKRITSLLNRAAFPVQGEEQDCREYFASLGGPQASHVNDDHAAQMRKAMGIRGPAKVAVSAPKQPTQQPALTGFEGYPDANSLRYLHCLVGCQKLGAAQEFCQKLGGVKTDPEGLNWLLPTKPNELKKYFVRESTLEHEQDAPPF